MPLMPEGWDVWLEELFNVSNTNKDDDLLFFVNEDEYVEELQKRGFKTQSEERNFGISASLIRENPSNIGDLLLNHLNGTLLRKFLY